MLTPRRMIAFPAISRRSDGRSIFFQELPSKARFASINRQTYASVDGFRPQAPSFLTSWKRPCRHIWIVICKMQQNSSRAAGKARQQEPRYLTASIS